MTDRMDARRDAGAASPTGAQSAARAETAASAASAGSALAREGSSLSPDLRLQILTTEHWSLLSTRNLSWNEAFSRATMFLSLLSGAVVALALVARSAPSTRASSRSRCVCCRWCSSWGSRPSCVLSRSTARTEAGPRA